MPLEYSKSVPAMFARVYTAPPQEVFYDMYENDISFDDAAKNLLDKEMAQLDDTDMMDELLDPDAAGLDPMEILGNDDVEKAIYQIGLAQEQGADPAGMTTPYGPGLAQEQLDQIINEYPGINAGVEWRTMDDHYHDAEGILSDPGAGSAIDNLMDIAVARAEDEGAIDSLGDIFKGFGEQLGKANERTAEAHVAERTEIDPDTEEMLLGSSDGPNPSHDLKSQTTATAEEVARTFLRGQKTNPPSLEYEMGSGDNSVLDAILKNLNAMEGYEESPGWFQTVAQTSPEINPLAQPTPIPKGRLFGDSSGDIDISQPLVDMLELIFTQIDSGGVPADANAVILNDIHNLFTAKGEGDEFDPDIFTKSLSAWVTSGGWDDRVEGAGGDPNKLSTELLSVFGLEGTRDTSQWASETLARTKSRQQTDTERAILQLMADDKTLTREQATEKFKEMSPENQTLFIEDLVGPVGEEEMRSRHNRALSRSFYNVVYAQPWGGKAEFQSILPSMFAETKTLFFMEQMIGGINNLTKHYKDQEPPKPGEEDAEYQAGDDYKDFMRRYLQNPDVFRKGTWLADRILRINTLMRKAVDSPMVLTKEQADKMSTGEAGKAVAGWEAEDVRDWWGWVQPLFSGDVGAGNRYNLIAMVATQGQQGYMANIIKNGVKNAIQHYERLGFAGSEIFTMLTKTFADTRGADKGEGARAEVKAATADVTQGQESDVTQAAKNQAETKAAEAARQAAQTKAATADVTGDDDDEDDEDADRMGRPEVFTYPGSGWEYGDDLDGDDLEGGPTAPSYVLPGAGSMNQILGIDYGDPGSPTSPEYYAPGASSMNQILNIGNGGPGETPAPPPASPYANLYSDPTGDSTLLQRPNSLRDALIHNRLSQGETMQEAMDWVNNELQDFPQQPVDFANPAAFAASLGPGGKARMLGTGSAGQVVPRVTRPQSDYDMSALRGQVLSPEEIDAILAGEIV